jgi:hypothetical protein
MFGYRIAESRPSDLIIEVVNTLHYGINEGKTPAEIIVFYAGTLADPTSIIEK